VDGDLMGDGVNIAARLEGIAKPSAISLSEDAYRQGSGPEFQLPSLLPIISEASPCRSSGDLPSEVGNGVSIRRGGTGLVPPKKPKDPAR
jgi:class 3 adenylate cyclase